MAEKVDKFPPEFYETGTLPTRQQVLDSYPKEYWAKQAKRLIHATKVVEKARAKKLIEKLEANPRFRKSKDPAKAYIIVGARKPSPHKP